MEWREEVVFLVIRVVDDDLGLEFWISGLILLEWGRWVDLILSECY